MLTTLELLKIVITDEHATIVFHLHVGARRVDEQHGMFKVTCLSNAKLSKQKRRNGHGNNVQTNSEFQHSKLILRNE